MKIKPDSIHFEQRDSIFLILLRFSEELPHQGKGQHKELIEEILREKIGLKNGLYYDEFGKPRLADEGFISLSYCKNYIAIAYDKAAEMGIDIETEREQLQRIAPRYLHPAEQAEWQASEKPQSYLQLSWGAKEALYKVYGRKKLIFKENLLLSGLHPAVAETFTGCIKTSELTRFYELSWFKPDPKTWVVFVVRQVNQ